MTGVLALVALGGSPPASADPASARLDFEDAIQTFNRDVFFLDHSTLRNPTADTPGDAQLYSEVGAALPVTWGQWQASSATSVLTTLGAPDTPSTQARLRLTGLVPDGVYSVFYGTLGPDSEHPGCPGVERTLPLPRVNDGGRAPDPASFVADSDGSAVYVGRIKGDLLAAGQVFFSIVYHFDGMTYYPFPNRGEHLTHDGEEPCRDTYGLDAMRHVLVLQKVLSRPIETRKGLPAGLDHQRRGMGSEPRPTVTATWAAF